MRSAAVGRMGCGLGAMVCLLVGSVLSASAKPEQGAAQMRPLAHTIQALVPFRSAPFPYEGFDPETHRLFLDVDRNGQRGHQSARGGGVYWLNTTYSDNRVLLALPEGFDLERPAVLVVFFHGNNATLTADVIDRQQVVTQLSESGINGALIAPQLAVNALDSSAGGFWTPGTFARFLREAAAHLSDFYEDAPEARTLFNRLPVVIVAYSGGYDPAAFALSVGGAGKRIRGVVLLDAAFGQTDRFVDWFVRNRRDGFFFSAFTKSSAAGNAAIEAELRDDDVHLATSLPRSLAPGSVTLLPVYGANHEDFVTEAWVQRPLAWLLARIPAFSRRPPSAAKEDP